MTPYTEDLLVQQTTANYLTNNLGWDSVYAYNDEILGGDGTLGRRSEKEIILTRYLNQALRKLNPDLPDEVYESGIRQISEVSSAQTLLATNQEKYDLLKNGVKVRYRNEKNKEKQTILKIFDFDIPENNHFLCVRELWVRGEIYRKRPDIMGFVNGIPLLFIECKYMHRDLEVAYRKNFADYKDTVPHIFHFNAVIMLANGEKAKIGSLTSKYEHFHEWKRLNEQDPGVVDMETLLKGVCDKKNFMDLFENFILFDDSLGPTVKILGKNHQFLGVNQAIEAVNDRKKREGKLGVFWHTQGSGKSYSMVFFTRKIHRKLGGNFTFLICTDRDDLDGQIYKTFAGCKLVNHDKDPCRASDGKHLAQLLTEHKSHIFTLVQKFNQDVDPDVGYTSRDDIIVITDEAHRTQYGTLALNMRNALPNASFIGFTGTPLFKDDEITKRVFGDYVSTYDFQRAVEDGATVPLYYDARGEKLGISTTDLNDRILKKIEEISKSDEADFDDINVQQRIENELKRDYHIITAEKRLRQVAHDLVEHYSTGWESGKAMLVCIDKVTCVRMHKLLKKCWQNRIDLLTSEAKHTTDDQEELFRKRQIAWMEETEMVVVISEEQNEVEKFRKWGLEEEIKEHRRLIREGFTLEDGKRIDLESAFKKPEHPFRIAIVCAMWLTGFDVPSLSTLYLDKPLKAHTLMQAIARANRVAEGKNNGLVVDYCGILKNLRKALATFAGTGDGGRGGKGGENNPTRPEEELLADLVEAIGFVKSFLATGNAPLDNIIAKTGFERNAAIVAAKEVANRNDQTRKRFEVMCREVFKKFKACITINGVNDHRQEFDAINIIYKSLQDDRQQADITYIIRELHKVVDGAIDIQPDPDQEPGKIYDISKIDFYRLNQEFSKSKSKHTSVQMLKDVIDKKVERLLSQNPLRTDFQKHYEEIIDEYNNEKDRVTIEETWNRLLKFIQDLDDESHRAIREELDEESLAIYDLLRKEKLTSGEIKRIKKVSVELLKTLKAEKLKIDHWREKESTRDSVLVSIRNYLYSEDTGLPVESYTDEEVEKKAEVVYEHVYRVYPEIPSPYYGHEQYEL
ncbi:type I restriction endonuclease subunit R [Methanospirillum sp.]